MVELNNNNHKLINLNGESLHLKLLKLLIKMISKKARMQAVN